MNNVTIIYYSKESKLVIELGNKQVFINHVTKIEIVAYDLLYFQDEKYIGMLTSIELCNIIIK